VLKKGGKNSSITSTEKRKYACLTERKSGARRADLLVKGGAEELFLQRCALRLDRYQKAGDDSVS